MDSAELDFVAEDSRETPTTTDATSCLLGQLEAQGDDADSMDDETQDRLYKQTQFWDTLDELRGCEGKLCTLVQNIPFSTHVQKVIIHFQSKKRSNGGAVKCVARMPDGYLIAFEDEHRTAETAECENIQTSCQRCLEKKGQKLGKHDISIYPKIFPTLHRGKFLVEGVPANTMTEKLTIFLKQCLKCEVVPAYCRKLENSDDYLVEYKDEIHTENFEMFIQNVQNSRLDGVELKVKQLHRSDCLKVSNLPKDVTIDQIQQAFDDVGYGVVTRIDLTGNKSALVYFTNFEDAEKIQAMNGESFSINGHHAKIELYYHTLSNDHDMILESACRSTMEVVPQFEESKDLTPFQETTNETSVVQFIHNSAKHHELFKQFFEDCATVEIAPSDGKEKSQINFIPKMVNIAASPSSPGKSQKIFEENCLKYLQNFLSKYTAEKMIFSEEKLERANQIITEVENGLAENNDDIAISWQSGESTIEVVGLKEKVDFVIQEINSQMKHAIATLPENAEKYKVLVHCGILSDVQQNHQKVEITRDDEESTVTVEGDETEVRSFKIAALSALNEIESKKLTTVNEYVVKFLAESLEKGSGTAGTIRTQVQCAFNSSGVQAVIGVDDGEVCVKYRVTDHGQNEKAIEVIERLISFDEITLNEDVSKNDVVKCSDWKNFREELCIDGRCSIFSEVDEKIVIVATTAELDKYKKEVETYLDQNTIEQLYMPMTNAKARYIIERSKEFGGDVSIQRVIKCNWSEEDKELLVETKRKHLQTVKSEIDKLVETVFESPFELEDLGMKEYFASEDGKQYLSTVESGNNCVILMDSEERDLKSPIKRNKRAVSKKLTGKKYEEKYHGEEWTSRTLPNTSVILKVYKTDIIRHNCDAIFCACDQDMKILANGASGNIKRIDTRNGGKIQAEIDKSAWNPMPGEALLTSAGCMQSYKKLIQVIIPGSDSRSKKSDPTLILKACISNGLKEAEMAKLKSVAIPAICCGKGGFDASTCAALILEAAHDYFSENTESSLKQLHFVEGNSPEVLQRFKQCVEDSCPSGVKPAKPFKRFLKSFRRKSAVAKLEKSQEEAESKSLNRSLKVELVEGNIADQVVDVIVNITDNKSLGNTGYRTTPGPGSVKYLANLGTAISQALCQKLDADSKREIEALKAATYIPGTVLVTNAGGLTCNKLYHALVTTYNPPESLNYLCSVVAECLKMANVSGYRSIAFPAIATGGFGHPPLLVAKLMRREFLKFSGENPKTVTIVLHPENPTAISTFQAEFNLTAPELAAFPSAKISRVGNASGQNEIFFEVIDKFTAILGQTVISVSRGNVTEQNCDFLVNITNDRFDLKEGNVSREILRKGGMEIQNEAILKLRSFDPTYETCIVTSGGNLPCEKIIHIAEPKTLKDLERKLMDVFHLVPRNPRGTSMSFADFGKVIAPSAVAGVMRKALKKASGDNKYLVTIFIVTRDEKVIAGFQEVFCTVEPEKTLFQKGRLVYKKSKKIIKELIPSPSKSPDVSQEQTSDSDTFELYIHSTSEEDIAKAKECIIGEAERLKKTSVISDDAIRRFTAWEKYELREAAERNKVKITDTSNRYLGRLAIRGLEEAVEKAREEIENIIKEFIDAETCANYFTWERKTDFDEWETYQPRAAYVLEKEYKTRKAGEDEVSLGPILVPEFGNGGLTGWPVDLLEMDLDSPKIRRTPKGGGVLDIPSAWQHMGDRQLAEIALTPTSSEYNSVLMKFQNGRNFNPIVTKIERIQNISLYKQYAAKRAEVKEKLKIFEKPIEQKLFHGTNDDEPILIHGFDRSYAGKNATLYGKGVYFACDPSYSNSYATPNAQGERRMFLADVLTGDYCLGKPDMAAPPMKQNSHIENDLYDSVVNNLRDPSIYVIFKDASAYPAYRITYTT